MEVTNSVAMQQPQREKHINFLYVSSLVFMIFFAIRVFANSGNADSMKELSNTSGIPNSLKGILSDMATSFNINFGIIVIAFAAVLTFFVYAALLRSKNPATYEQRVKRSKILFIFSFVVAAAGIAYLISDVRVLGQFDEFVKLAKQEVTINEEVLNGARSGFMGGLGFDVVFVVFGIVNIVLSWKFAKNLKQSAPAPATDTPTITDAPTSPIVMQ